MSPPLPVPEDRGYTLVASADALRDAVEVLTGSPFLAIDTEADSFYSYRERCCLVQIAGHAGPDYIVDPLAVPDLSPLAPLMADPAVTKIFHGADYDVVTMKRDFGFEFHTIFDTMIAAQATAHERFGLGDLVAHYFGVTLDKRWQRHDWSARPLLAEHLDYARRDVHYLQALRQTLWEQAADRGRQAMLQEEFALLEARAWTERSFDPDECMKIRGARKLDEVGRRVLRALHALREEKARAKDRPPFKVWAPDVALAVAEARPVDLDALTDALGSKHHVVRRYGEDIVAAVQAGLADTTPPPDPDGVRPAPRSLPPVTRDDEPLVQRLKDWRNKQADAEGVGPGMIVNNGILKDVASIKPADVDALDVLPDLRRWQKEAYGEALVAVVQAWLATAPAPAPKPKRRRRKPPVDGAAAPAGEAAPKRRRRRRRRTKDAPAEPA